MKVLSKLLVFFSLLAVMAGCSQYSLVDSQVYNDADLGQIRTFRIVSPDDGNLPPGMGIVTYYNIAAAIREQLVERGFTEDPNSPIFVNIGLTVKKEIATEPAIPPGAPIYGPYGPWGAPVYNGLYPYYMYPRALYWQNYYANARLITGIYREGVLSLDIVNMEKKLPLFSASVATILDNGDSQFRNLKGIAEAVTTLFSKFPVTIMPQYR